MNYLDLKSCIQALNNLDLDTHYIDRNLAIKAKPGKNTCWQRFRAIFAKSKSKEILIAMQTLKESVEQNKTLISKDQDLRDGIVKLNNLVSGKLVKQQTHSIKSLAHKHTLKQICKEIKKLNSEMEEMQEFEASDSIQDISSPEELANYIKNDLDLFIDRLEEAFTKELSEEEKKALADEASCIFSELALLLNEADDFITRENANALFRQLFTIKAYLLDKKDKAIHRNLRGSYLALTAILRKPFFEERLSQAVKDVAKIRKKMFWQSKTIKKIVSGWEADLKKSKVPSIPKYYHCTDSANDILKDPIGIVYRADKQKGYAGVFASTKPEGIYGAYCFALSDTIERKVHKKYPIVTNVNSGTKHSTSKIYIGGDGHKTTARPRLWLGFKQPFVLVKPNKMADPISYYEERTLSFIGITSYSQKKSSLNQEILTQRKITVLEKQDFDELCRLVHSALPVVLPKDWGENVTCPMFCSLVPRKAGHLGVVALENMHGVQSQAAQHTT